ncbi:hypothetical protein ECG_00528 [Echinococcus granulosus]|nr:hypothetical protein ECG_00528 [Echinococcus granulosus]CDS16627.1 DSS1 SEM1 domain containing protein [Echinococcus granulosus]
MMAKSGVNEKQGMYQDVNEFEEFIVEDWDANEEDASDKNVWDEEWDREDYENDEFTQRLRSDLQKWGYLA